MSAETAATNTMLEALRKAFDESFAAPAKEASEPYETMLVIRAGGERFAVRLSEIGGVEACRKIMPLPGGAQGLLGLAGLKRRLFGVFRLAALLGLPAAEEPPRWLLVCPGSDDSIALGFDGIEGHFNAAPSQLMPGGTDRPGDYVRDVVRQGELHYNVLHIPSLASATMDRSRDRREATA